MADTAWYDWTGLNEVFEMNGPDGEWCEVLEHDPTAYSGEGNPFYGEKHTDETKAQLKSAASRRGETEFAKKQRVSNAKKTWTFISPEYKIVRIRGSLNQFCQERGLNVGAMAALHKHKLVRGHQHKGWRKLHE